jgi:hypothetical protein
MNVLRDDGLLHRQDLLVLLMAFGIVEVRARLQGSSRGLPYSDSFANRRPDEWRAFGGRWELKNGTMLNDPDEPDAKLLTSPPHRHDYLIQADVDRLAPSRDAGLAI